MANEIKRDTVDYRDTTPFDNTKLNSLSEISKALRHKTYGEDTREAIAQQGEALAKLMQEAGGNQLAEVVEARGPFEVLGIREIAQEEAIGAANTNIANKADKAYIEEYLAGMSTAPNYIDDYAKLIATYPGGKPGLWIAMDTDIKYFWDGSKWADKGVYGTKPIAENGVKYTLRTRKGEQGRLIANQGIDFNIDTVSKTIRYNVAIGVLNGSTMHIVKDETGSTFEMLETGYILFNTLTDKLYMVQFTDDDNTPERESSLMIGQINYDGHIVLNTSFDYKINGKLVKHQVTQDDMYKTRTGSITWGSQNHANLVTNDGQWRLELPLSLIATGMVPIFNIPPTGSNENDVTSYDMSNITSTGGYITYNQRTGVISSVNPNQAFNPDDVTIGHVWGTGQYALYGGGSCYLNGEPQMNMSSYSIPSINVSAAAQTALVNTDGVLAIDIAKKTIQFENAENVDISVGKTQFFLKDLHYDGSNLVGNNPQSIVIDLADKTIKATDPDKTVPESCAVIAKIWNWGLGHYYDANSNLLIKINGQIINNAGTYGYNKEALAIGGDSTIAGFIGQEDDEHHIHTKLPVDHWINLRLGLKTDNIGVDGASIFGTGEKSLATINAKVDWTNYTKYGLQIGVNDYQGNTAPLTDVIEVLKAQLDLIYDANPSIKIYAALPLQSYREPGWVEGSAMDVANNFGDTLNDYMDALKSVYREYEIPVLDWRDSPIITKRGYKTQTVDFLHPNDHTYMIMGQRWASFLDNNR